MYSLHDIRQIIEQISLVMDNNSSSNGLPPNNSNQKLVTEDYLDSETTTRNNKNGIMHSASAGDLVISNEDIHGRNRNRKMTKREWITVSILCFVNLINYMDRFTIAGKRKYD